MKKIQLTQNQFAIVDDEDFVMLSEFSWYAHKDYCTYYAMRGLATVGKYKRIQMHRQVLNVSDSQEVDHIDGDGLNNQKHNLRICTRSQNCSNRKIPKNNTSGFKGVYYATRLKKYIAIIKVNKKPIFLGTFADPRMAGLAYDEAAIKYFGQFALTNGMLGRFWNPHWQQERVAV